MSQGAGAAGTTTEFREYQWAYSIMDSSRVSTCLISMLLIVYGSFRSLNMEQEQREREQKKRANDSLNNLLTGEPVQMEQSKFATLDAMHALCLPLGASVALLVMFFFFDSMQMLLAVCTASEFFFCFWFICQMNQIKFIILIYSYSNSSSSIFITANVSIYYTSMFGWQSNLIWCMRSLYISRIIKFFIGIINCMRMGINRSLVVNGW